MCGWTSFHFALGVFSHMVQCHARLLDSSWREFLCALLFWWVFPEAWWHICRQSQQSSSVRTLISTKSIKYWVIFIRPLLRGMSLYYLFCTVRGNTKALFRFFFSWKELCLLVSYFHMYATMPLVRTPGTIGKYQVICIRSLLSGSHHCVIYFALSENTKDSLHLVFFIS